MPRISIIGDLAIDYVLEADTGSQVDEKIALTSVIKQAGGTGGNAACAAARLGAEVRLHTITGDDRDSHWLIEQTTADGVDLKATQTRSGPPARAFVVHEGAHRHVYTDMAIMEHLLAPSPEDLADADLVYVSYSPKIAQQILDSPTSTRTVVGLETWMLGELMHPSLLEAAGLVVTNEAGWRSLIEVLPAPLSTPVVETRGSRGCRIHWAGRAATDVPALAVRAVDATGAGDCFAGALCRYLAAGHDLRTSVELATIAAALSTTAVGARGAQPDDETVQAHHRSLHGDDRDQ